MITILSLFHRPLAKAIRAAGSLVFAAWLMTGCASDQPPPPQPLAARQAESTAADARRYVEQSRWDRAADRWQDAAQRFALLNDRAQEAVALHNLALAERHLDKPEQALNSLQKASALNESLARTSEWWRNQLALLQIRSQLNQTQNLTSMFDDLRSREDSIEDDTTLGLFLNELGLWQWRQGDPDAALRTFDRALRSLAKADSESGQATVRSNQAMILEEQERWTDATTKWREARRGFEKLGDARGIALALAGEGRSLLEAGTSPDEAADLLRRAARNYRLLNLPKEQADVERLLKQRPKPDAEQ